MLPDSKPRITRKRRQSFAGSDQLNHVAQRRVVLPAAGIVYVEARAHGRPFGHDHFKPAVPDLGLGTPPQDISQSEPLRGRIYGGLRVADRAVAGHIHPHHGLAIAQFPPERRIVTQEETQAGMLAEIGGLPRPVMRLKIFRCADDNPFQRLGESDCDHVLRNGVPVSYAGIIPLRDHVDRAVLDDDRQSYVGEASTKGREHRAHYKPAGVRGDVQSEFAEGAAAHVVDFRQCRADLVKPRLQALGKPQPCRRRSDATARAIEEFRTETLLQPADGVAEGRRRNPQLDGGRLEAAAPDDDGESRQVRQFGSQKRRHAVITIHRIVEYDAWISDCIRACKA